LRENRVEKVDLVAALCLPRHELVEVGLGAAVQVEEFVDMEDAHIIWMR
jgi:hypothetical protein